MKRILRILILAFVGLFTLAGTSACGTVTSILIYGNDMTDCQSTMAQISMDASTGDTEADIAVTTTLVADCMEFKGYECTRQTNVGEYRPGFPREYGCIDTDGVGGIYGEGNIREALNEAIK